MGILINISVADTVDINQARQETFKLLKEYRTDGSNIWIG